MDAAVPGGTVTDIALQDALGWLGWGLPALEGKPLRQISEVSAALIAPGDPGTIVRPRAVSNIHWTDWLNGGIAAFAYRALQPTTPQAYRDALVALIRVWTSTPFATDPGCFRYIWVDDEPNLTCRGVTYHGGEAFFSGRLLNNPYPSSRRLIHYSADRSFAAAGAWTVLESAPPMSAGWATPEHLEAFLATLADRGPLVWHDEDVARLAQRLQISRAGAVVLIAGMPGARDDVRNGTSSIDDEVATLTGLTASELSAALDEVATPPDLMDNINLYAHVLPDDIEEMWSPEGRAAAHERLAVAWEALRTRSMMTLRESLSWGTRLALADDSARGAMPRRAIVTVAFDAAVSGAERRRFRALVDNWAEYALGRIFEEGSIAYVSELVWDDLDENTDIAASASLTLDFGSAPATRAQRILDSLRRHIAHCGVPIWDIEVRAA